MSTNSNCDIVEESPGRWFYILEDYDAPKNAWDWREYASAYGPFQSDEAAEKHLYDNHANPGGTSTSPLPSGLDKLDLSKDDVLRRLIESAQNPRQANSMRYGYSRAW